ncbi:MAG: tRNA (adenosine(37)-N6)-threonylcarbamoyltransferase complex transferase subunit TsaD [Candidatus Marinimicrobia bacterium]|nr:tRNA (adenosine(37)-N6)-threonylcarbamoyltransferase complex transferase subunit TsaD [Candidatus Neomarinimicrobiota bacterium]MBL7023113.1 tRNA (adenosine(37)-N6)-threonylcarbamoyltransferase complex transferase subunit TsaD [Candidatus Neomarinimicrobiota bacterium]MBL7109133.1 tRNA (adenosine(37)-N6)-threonylcarbamoyltransferase complex transferase subunit TsaD [Candidatus Neomarinimicrobiota bacterium]
MTVLGIETSCDETSASIIKDGKLLSNVVLTQEIHRKYGGVVPEVASREHEHQIISIVDSAMKRASISKTDLNAVAVTYGAGLFGALLVGLNVAKGIAIGLGIPFLGVNHMEGHLFANMIDNPEFDYPFLCLLVSGGHTQIWKVEKFGDYQLVGQTRDDAAGEAFDKGARILGLNYPGGPEIEKNAQNGDTKAFHFTIPKVKASEFDFSFSGLKTALLYTVRKISDNELKDHVPNLCASFQEVIIDTLLDKLEKSIDHTGLSKIAVAGGVAANQRFRQKAQNLEQKLGVNIYFPDLKYCTDNAAMIAMAGYERLKNGEMSSLNLRAVPNLMLDTVCHD